MKKETFEWIHSWCDYTEKDDLPRVLLIGDSITNGYNALVRESLKGIAYVDYVATSYSIDNPLYQKLVKEFVNNSNYDVIHFNFGLHGKHLSTRRYRSYMRKMTAWLLKKSKVILVELTTVNEENNKKVNKEWRPIIAKRNKVVNDLAEKFRLPVDHLFETSCSISKELRTQDGWHYMEEGSKILAEKVVASIKASL